MATKGLRIWLAVTVLATVGILGISHRSAVAAGQHCGPACKELKSTLGSATVYPILNRPSVLRSITRPLTCADITGSWSIMAEAYPPRRPRPGSKLTPEEKLGIFNFWEITDKTSKQWVLHFAPCQAGSKAGTQELPLNLTYEVAPHLQDNTDTLTAEQGPVSSTLDSTGGLSFSIHPFTFWNNVNTLVLSPHTEYSRILDNIEINFQCRKIASPTYHFMLCKMIFPKEIDEKFAEEVYGLGTKYIIFADSTAIQIESKITFDLPADSTVKAADAPTTTKAPDPVLLYGKPENETADIDERKKEIDGWQLSDDIRQILESAYSSTLDHPRDLDALNAMSFDQRCGSLTSAVCAADDAQKWRAFHREVARMEPDVLARAVALSKQAPTDPGEILKNPSKWWSLYQSYAGFLESEAAKPFGLTQGAMDQLMNDVRKQLLLALNGDAQLSKKKRAIVEKTLMSMKFSFLSDRLKAVSPDDSFIQKIRDPELGCGPNLLNIQGLFYYDGKSRTLIVCPGLLIDVAIGMKEWGLSPSLEGFFFIVAHEIGHSIDSTAEWRMRSFFSNKKIALDYSGVQSCLDRSKSEFQKNPNLYLAESVADLWATEALLGDLKTKKLDPKAQFALLRTRTSPLCHGIDDGVHPDSAFRLNSLIGGNRELKNLIGCGSDTDPRPAANSCEMKAVK